MERTVNSQRPAREQLMIKDVVLQCYSDKYLEANLLAQFDKLKNGYGQLQDLIDKYDAVWIVQSDEYRYNKKRRFTFHRRPNLLSLKICLDSLIIHISFEDLEELNWIHHAVLNGRMKEIFQNSFNEFLKELGIALRGELIKHLFLVNLSNRRFLLELADAHDETAKQALLRNGEENTRKFFSRPAYKDAQEMTMKKAFVLIALDCTKETSRPKAPAFKYLAEVRKEWGTTFKRSPVESTLKRPLAKLLNKPELETKLNSGVKWNVGEKIICFATLPDYLFIVTENKGNVIQRCNMNSLRKVQVQDQPSGTADKPTSPVAVTLRSEDITMPENIKISYMEAAEDETGIFFIAESNESDERKIWFLSTGEGNEQPRQAEQQLKVEQQRQASKMKQFSPTKFMTLSDIGQSSKDEKRILLKILVTLQKKVDRDNILEIHPQHAESIPLPSTVHKPMSVIRNSQGYIFVIDGDRIFMIDNKGSIVLTYGDNPKGHPEKLNEPCSMTLGDDGRIYVADKGNNRILLLGSDMHLIKVLLDEKYDGIRKPTQVRYTQNLNKLIVACENSIHIYGDGKFHFTESPQEVGTKAAAISEEKKVKE